MDVVVAATGDDEDNLVVANLAKFEFEVPRVVARVKNALNTWLYEPDIGVDVVVSAPHTIAQLIEEQVAVGDVVQLLTLAEGQAALARDHRSPNTRRSSGSVVARGRVAPRLRRRGRHPRHPRPRRARQTRARGRRPPALRHRRRADGAAAPPARHDAAPPLRRRRGTADVARIPPEGEERQRRRPARPAHWVLVRTGKYSDEVVHASGVELDELIDSIADLPAMLAGCLDPRTHERTSSTDSGAPRIGEPS